MATSEPLFIMILESWWLRFATLDGPIPFPGSGVGYKVQCDKETSWNAVGMNRHHQIGLIIELLFLLNFVHACWVLI